MKNFTKPSKYWLLLIAVILVYGIAYGYRYEPMTVDSGIYATYLVWDRWDHRICLIGGGKNDLRCP